MKPAWIVVVEDNQADFSLIELALQENGVLCEITRFNTGHEALEFLCRRDAAISPLPEAILLDLNTPRSDGFEVLGTLKRTPHLAGIPVVILTSSDAPGDRNRTILMGAARYISKPSHLEDFLATVGEAVKKILRDAPESIQRLT